jgi:nucleotide-binding universal stress UspA family protein
MSKLFMGPSCKALITLALDETDASVLDVARLLSTRAGHTLRLFHATPSFARHLPALLVDAGGPLSDLSEAVDESREISAEAALRKVAAGLEAPAAPETSVAVGRPVETILADAVSNRARLIVVGRAAPSYERVPKSWSTVLRLVASAPVPVVVADPQRDPSRLDRRLKMLIADDLALGGEDTALVGLDLARALGGVDILHLHVNPVTMQTVHEALRDLAARDPNAAASFVAGELVERSRQRLSGVLEERASARLPLLESRGCTYQAAVASGDALLEIEREAAAFGADLLIFGRHRTASNSPDILGKIPHASMLREGRIVVVVPPRS